uniref:AbrB/MazE/SpoVT family DNA-binding domain-containing protein n=1 Tax=candidate division CPR3 bacterium TaxID=2268181 RepID=A0A7C4R632_UNCC3
MQGHTTLKLFGTGQVTIPKKWRDALKAKEFEAVINDDGEIILRPIEFGWVNVFNAERDGGSMDAKELSRALKKDIKKHEQNRKVSKKN